jgi:hypothetical protein
VTKQTSEDPPVDDGALTEREDRGDASRWLLALSTAAAVVVAVIALAAAEPRLSGPIIGALLVLVVAQLRPAWRRWPSSRSTIAIVGSLLVAGAIAGFVVGSALAGSGTRAAQPGRPASSPSQADYPLLPAVAGDRALRVAFQPTTPEMFLVAFPHDIGKPTAGTGWRQLHEQGGVDVQASTFALTLTNRTQLPLAVTNIVAEVTASASAPTEWLGGIFSQGVGNLDQYVASLESETSGSQAIFKLSETHEGTHTTSPFFATRQITLKPGEIYDAAVTVDTQLKRELRYRFLVSGNTATESFTLDVSPKGGYRLSGDMEPKYAHRWGMSVGGTSVAGCWRTTTEEVRELDGHAGPCKQG